QNSRRRFFSSTKAKTWPFATSKSASSRRCQTSNPLPTHSSHDQKPRPPSPRPHRHFRRVRRRTEHAHLRGKSCRLEAALRRQVARRLGGHWEKRISGERMVRRRWHAAPHERRRKSRHGGEVRELRADM